MQNITLYLNGDRGIKVLETLIKLNKYTVFVFSLKKIVFPYKFSEDKIVHKLIKNINDKKHILNIKNINPYLSIVAGFPQIFNEELINLPEFGTINLHAGPLPKYRGGSPLNWQIINGEDQIGISIIQMAEGIDTGDIICKSSFKLNLLDNIKTVHNYANKLFSNMVINVLEQIESKSQVVIKQDSHDSIYWHQRSDLDGRINWQKMTALQVYNFIRALTKPYPGAYTFFSEYKLRIFLAELTNEKFYGTPGRVVKIKKNKLLVICADKGLFIKKYKFEKYSGCLKSGMQLK